MSKHQKLASLPTIMYDGEPLKKLQVSMEKFLTRGAVDRDDCPVEIAVSIKDGDYVYLKKGIEARIDDVVLVNTHTWGERVLRHYEPHTEWAVFRSSYDRDDDISEKNSNFTIEAVCVAIEHKNGGVEPTRAHNL